MGTASEQVRAGAAHRPQEPLRSRPTDVHASHGDRAAPPEGGRLTPTAVTHLQRSAGNHAVAGVIQRDGPTAAPARPPSVRERLSALEAREAATRKRQQATQIDVRWRSMFGERLASYQGAIYRITQGINSAASGFQQAQSAQAQSDAMKAQVIGLVITVAAAGAFEPLMMAGLGALGSRFSRLGLTAARIERVTERLENPVVAAVGGVASNIRGTQVANQAARQGQVPSVPATGAPGAATPAAAPSGTDALGFLTANLEALAGFQQSMEGAFASRASALAALPDEDMATFDPTATEAAYRAILDGMNAVCAGVERLRPVGDIAAVYERFMWAAWLQGESATGARIAKMRRDMGRAQAGLGPSAPNPADAHEYSIGTDIEDHLRTIGVARLAGVQLTGHWYSSNSPSNWTELLLAWARSYRESIATS